ncbi:MAG: PQQ-binding-like beta-propeller repeat protein [Candidatus Hydrogenedentes bacterium]|nr:PQQ-binding-like beta-propeller repeat protein [Candidatus Hydrogenedentota bacterium]
MPPTWETYHGAPSLDGASSVSLPNTLTRIWRYDSGAPVSNTPVVGNDRVCLADKKGVLHGLDLNGKAVWSKPFSYPAAQGKPQTPVEFEAPLALFESTLIACAASGVIYAINATDGELRWECNTDYPILGTPNFATVRTDGETQKRLFVIDQSEGALQCLDFASGKRVWRGEGVARCDGSAAVSDAFAVYGSCAGALHVFSTVTGNMLREIPLDEDSQVAGGAVLLGEHAFSSSRSGKFVHVNVQTGTTLWVNANCDAEAFSTPAVGPDRVVFTANDGVVYALDRQTGDLKWRQKLGDTPSSPVIAGDKVLVSAGGTLYMLKLLDGEKLWSYAVSDEITSPALAGSLVVVGADDGSVAAFGGG